MCESSDLRQPTTMAEASQLLSVLKQADYVLKIYEPQIFIEAGQLLSLMLPCQGNGIRGVWFRLTNSAYKAACKKTTELRRGLKAQWTIAIVELSEALQTRQQWQRLSESECDAQRLFLKHKAATNSTRQPKATFAVLKPSANRVSWDLGLRRISARVSALSSDKTTPYRIRRLVRDRAGALLPRSSTSRG